MQNRGSDYGEVTSRLTPMRVMPYAADDLANPCDRGDSDQ